MYFCEKYNPYNNHNLFLIVDESELILSSAYLHVFVNEISHEKYGIISDSIGIPMPHLQVGKELVVGTSRYLYFFDVTYKNVSCKLLLNSSCVKLITLHNKLIVICESDVVIISVTNKHIFNEYGFDDTIIDYTMHQDYLILHLMEGLERKIYI